VGISFGAEEGKGRRLGLEGIGMELAVPLNGSCGGHRRRAAAGGLLEGRTKSQTQTEEEEGLSATYLCNSGVLLKNNRIAINSRDPNQGVM
jgi:hypothetical protein